MKFPSIAALAGLSLLGACAQVPPVTPVVRAVPAPAPVVMPAQDGRSANLDFEPMSAELQASARSGIALVGDRLRDNPLSRVTITTHTAPQRAPLARQRVMAVRQALVADGVSASRIRVVNLPMVPDANVNGVQLRVQDTAGR